MFLRAYRVCSPLFLDEEIEKIENIFRELRYPRHVIDKAHSKARKKYFSLSDDFEFNSQRKQIVCLPYAKAFENLNNILEASDLKVVHRFPNTVGKTLIKNSPSHIEMAGVYKVPCMDCNKSYYGETGGSFDIRLAEHRGDVQKL